MNNFLKLVKAERQKQINKHGYTPEHDDEHTNGEIANAAACYAATVPIFKVMANTDIFPMKTVYPWHCTLFSKQEKSRKEQIVTACAMLMAEYERIVRAEQKATVNLCSDCNLCPATCGASPKFGTSIEIDNVYECDMFQPKPYQMSCPYGLDSTGDPIKNQEPITFAPRHYQKILDRIKIHTARKRDKSGEFTIKGKRFSAEFEIAMTVPAFKSLFDSGFYTPEQFGFESSQDMWDYYHNYFEDLVYVHKISEVQS